MAQRHVAVFTRGAIDDLMALSWLLSKPNITVRAVVVVGSQYVPPARALAVVHATREATQNLDLPIIFPYGWRTRKKAEGYTELPGDLRPSQKIKKPKKLKALVRAYRDEPFEILSFAGAGPAKIFIEQLKPDSLKPQVSCILGEEFSSLREPTIEIQPSFQTQYYKEIEDLKYLDKRAQLKVFMGGGVRSLVAPGNTNLWQVPAGKPEGRFYNRLVEYWIENPGDSGRNSHRAESLAGTLGWYHPALWEWSKGGFDEGKGGSVFIDKNKKGFPVGKALVPKDMEILLALAEGFYIERQLQQPPILDEFTADEQYF